MKRRCPVCDAIVGGDPPGGDPRWHDACIRSLPGVNFACCGHGGEEVPYVSFDDGIAVYGRAALAVMEMLGGNPPGGRIRDTDMARFFVGAGYRPTRRGDSGE